MGYGNISLFAVCKSSNIKKVVVVLSITIISRDDELGLTQKKLEGYKKYSEIIQWGRKNPAKFAETFLGVT